MRLIDADRPKRAIQQTIVKEKLEGRNTDGLQQVVYLLDSCPTVDAVPVVRCKDCKQWGRNIGFTDNPNGHCFYHDIDTNGFDFCSYGERSASDV
jgi:hypothetical protein